MLKKILILILTILFLTSCWDNTKSINFAESSGICYMPNQNIFYVVSDEWEIQKVNSNLEKLEYFKFDKNYDFEAIICDEKNNNLLIIDEKVWEIYKIEMSTEGFSSLKITKSYKINWYKLDKKWIEWFAKIWENKYVISTQTKKENLLILEFVDKDFKVTKKIDFPYKDLSGLEYFNKKLYIISDKNDKVFIYDLEKEKINKIINLQKWAWEWISFDKNWNMFLSDDDWKIVKIKSSQN